MKFCLFGDSIAKGVKFDEERGRYVQMEPCFANLFREETHSDVENFACFGSTVDKGAQIYERKQASLADSDYVVFEFGGNDCDFDWEQVSKSPSTDMLCRTPMDRFTEVYGGLVTRAKVLGKRVVLLTLPPLDPERYFYWISENRNIENIKNFLGGSISFLYRWQELYNSAVRSLAAKTDAVLVDLRAAFLRERHYSDGLCIDGIHPNEWGHVVMSHELVDAFRTRLQNRI